MCITDARDRLIVPLHHFIQQAHQIGVGDQRANFRFVDCHDIECFAITGVPEHDWSGWGSPQKPAANGTQRIKSRCIILRQRRGILRLRFASLHADALMLTL